MLPSHWVHSFPDVERNMLSPNDLSFQKSKESFMDLGMKVILVCAAFMALAVVLGFFGKKLSDE